MNKNKIDAIEQQVQDAVLELGLATKLTLGRGDHIEHLFSSKPGPFDATNG